jgi:tetrahydromethanopterin S-methyltransferase subunit C
VRKSPFWRLVGMLLLGAVVGTLAGQLLAHQVPALGRTATVSWHPSADLAVLRYSIDITLRVNWLTLVGVIIAVIWNRRLK